ncbi:MAG: CRTAC1 family protein [Rhodothermales bacterium]|nr:CRTAC1 family protein [Rhodothermales bacterium]
MPYHIIRRLAALGCALLVLAGCGAPHEQAEAPPGGAAQTPSTHRAVAFTDVAGVVGVDFTYHNGMAGERFFIEIVGGGGAFFDYDGDGDLDLYAAQGHPLTPGRAPAHAFRDRLFRNDLVETGTLAFTDVTDASGIDARGYGVGAATADYDGDGHPDLYVLNWGPNQLWRNNGDGTFTDVTAETGTGDPRLSAGAAALDYDRDGDLDLMVVNYNRYTLETDHPCYAPSGKRDYCGPDAYPPEPDRLYRNAGDGTFEDVTFAVGMTAAYGPALGVVATDANGDGWPDLYVANDGKENQLWINQQGTRFVNDAVLAGTAVNAAGAAEASMGLTAGDFDNDGDDDFFLAHLNNETNTLYVNDGRGLFADRSRASGLALPSLAFTAFGVAALDADNDGWLDLYVANGEVRIIPAQDAAGSPFPMAQANQFFQNRGDGRFADATPRDALFALEEVSRGVAAGDVDNDGDTDLAVFNINGPLRLLRNETGQDRPWLGLRLVLEDGRDAIGARVALIRGTAPALWRHVHTDGSYASAHDPRILFGLGADPAFDAVHVYWPGGAVEAWNGLAPGRYHTLTKGMGSPVAMP